ncbi:MAG: hypothetical protein SangKO_029320 [Sandaracinaceae bacterium]
MDQPACGHGLTGLSRQGTHARHDRGRRRDVGDDGSKTRVRLGADREPHYELDESDPFAITITLPVFPAERRFVLVRDVLGPINDT